MGKVIEIDDGLSYIIEEESRDIKAVQWFKRNQFVEFRNDGYVGAIQKTDGSGIGKHELRQLMIMWLSINYPDTLAFDDIEREEKIKSEAKEDT